MKLKCKKISDNDGHWYWIPEDELQSFNKDLERLQGKEYRDDPDAFDCFMSKYDIYQTGGCPSIKPDVFKSEEVEFIH